MEDQQEAQTRQACETGRDMYVKPLADIRQIISQYLKENWCWGLQNDECECACEADFIMPHLECPNELCKAVPLDSEPEWSSDMAMEETWA